MKDLFQRVASCVLTLSAILVQIQSQLCYNTTTVVIGDPRSILNSLSTVANITSIHSNAPTKPVLSAVLATSTSSTTNSTSPAVTSLFRVAVNVPNTRKQRARNSPYYIAFRTIKDEAIIVSDESQAALFQLVNGYLQLTTGLYVGANTDNGTTQLEAFRTPPAVARGWTANSDGNLTLSGGEGFCSTSNDGLYIVLNGQSVAGCIVVMLAVVSEASVPSSITLSQVVRPSSAVSIASSVQSPLTTKILGSLSTFEGRSQLASLALLHSEIPLTTNTLGSLSTFEGASQLASLAYLHSEIPPPSSTSSSSSIPGSNITLPVSSTSPSARSTSVSSIFSSSLIFPPASRSSSFMLPPISLVGPGQSTTPVSSTFSIPIVVSGSVSSSTLTISSSSNASALSSRTSSTSLTNSGVSTSTSTSTVFSSSSFSSLTSFPAIATTSTKTILNTSLNGSSTRFLPGLPSPYGRNTGKRGLVYTNVTLTQLFSLQGQNSQVSWSYNYAQAPNASNNAGTTNPALTFIPLLFNDSPGATSSWSANVNYSIAEYGTDALFSFNEPDACYFGESACMTVNQSVAGYQSFMQPFAGTVKLGAPAVTNDGYPASLTYLSWFLGNCTGCTVDFINLHWYASPYSFSYLQSYVRQAYDVGGNRPIYITEFGMDSFYYLEADVATFLKNATTWLDAQPYVKRYSWFGDFAQSGPTGQQGFGFLVNATGNALSSQGVIFNNYTGGYVPCPSSSGC